MEKDNNTHQDIDPKYIKKDGTIAPLKKDGTLRIVGGGYIAANQEKWGRKVLRTASKIAKEMFGYFANTVLAQYLTFHCGYEGALRLFQKKVGGYYRVKQLLESFPRNIKPYKYVLFREAVFQANLDYIDKHRKKKKKDNDKEDADS